MPRRVAPRLADRGRAYAVYLPQGGKVAVDLSDAKEMLTGRWFNPRDGKSGQPFEVAPGRPGEFQASDGQDWVLCLSVPAK